jgi:Transposase family tnp2
MGVSRRGGDLIMSLVAIIVHLVFRSSSVNETRQADTLAQIPASITAALSKLNLDGRSTIYAICPACHCTYKPRFNRDSSIPIYPERCSNKPKPDSNECGEPLLETSGVSRIMKPIKPFVYHHFHDYLAGLLSRPDLEELMDKSCDNLMKSMDQPAPSFVGDVFEAEFLRTFEGPKPGTLFVDRQGGGRYAFSLNVDFFALEGMRIRGATASAGIISLACLNLPLDVRYKPENMYLSVIPGPKEPHLTEVNHYIRPLMDDMVDSWDKGVLFSRTALHPLGRMTNSAIIAAVMDLPAARKTSGLAGHSSHFYCTVCQCFHQSTLARTDFENWVKRDILLLRTQAEAWKNATTAAEQDKIFVKYGTRWSELWRLPYWDPSRQLVVDSMHCILEGLAHIHFREVLGLTTASASTPLPVVKAFTHNFTAADPHDPSMTAKEIKQVEEIHGLLTAPAEDGHDNWKSLKVKLLRKNTKPIVFVCENLGIQPLKPPQLRLLKADWVKALVEWVSRFYSPYIFPDLISIKQRDTKPRNTDDIPFKIVTPAVMQRIRDVIEHTATPSWINSVPYNFGDAAAGPLKADEWRTMSTIYLPLALISLWGDGTSHPSTDISVKLRHVLDHTMALVSAVTLACLRTMSQARATAYRNYIIFYIRELQNLHPEATRRTNQHMAMHIYDFLRLFGPVHSWWCFPFERLIGQLQRMTSNHKYGKSFRYVICYP